MSFCQNAYDGVVAFSNFLAIEVEEFSTILGEALSQGFLYEIYVGKLTVLAVIQIHRQVPCIKFHEPTPPCFM